MELIQAVFFGIHIFPSGSRLFLATVIFHLFSKCLISEAREYYRRYSLESKSYDDPETDDNLISYMPEFLHDTFSPVNLTVEKGQAAFLHCRIKNQGTFVVSWARYTKDFNILAVGERIFIPDGRFTLVRVPGAADWTLRILNVKQSDAGVYECQIGTTPKMGRNVTLTVIEALQADSGYVRPRTRTIGDEVARAVIKGEREAQVGQSLNLTCQIASSTNNITNTMIRWSHNETHHLTYDHTVRSGHQIEIYQSPTGMFSQLHIPVVYSYHAGKYTCSAKNAEASTIFVQVHPGSHPVALRRGANGFGNSTSSSRLSWTSWITYFILIGYFFFWTSREP